MKFKPYIIATLPGYPGFYVFDSRYVPKPFTAVDAVEAISPDAAVVAYLSKNGVKCDEIAVQQLWRVVE